MFCSERKACRRAQIGADEKLASSPATSKPTSPLATGRNQRRPKGRHSEGCSSAKSAGRYLCRRTRNANPLSGESDHAQRHPDHQARRGRHRIAGLGVDASAHVSPLGGAQGHHASVLDETAGRRRRHQESATVRVEGENAYGLLTGETRRPPPCSHFALRSAARRHTSFASIFVIPEIDDRIEVNIKPGRYRWTPSAPAARAGKTSTKLRPRSASPISPPASSCSARPNAASTRIARWP